VCTIKAWLISSAYKNLRGQHPLRAEMYSPQKIHLGGSMLANTTFLFVDQSLPHFFHGTRKESLSITFLSDVGYMESFRRHSRSKSKVVKNRAEFRTFFALPNFGGRPFKSYTHVMTPAWRHLVWKMFCEDTPTIALKL